MKLMKVCVPAFVAMAVAFGGVSTARGQMDPAPKSEPAPTPPAKDEPKKDEPKKDEPKKDEPKKDTPPTPPSQENKPVEPKLVYVKMSTSKGDMVIELNNEKAPISVKNFLSYVDKKYYDGTIFHRVIPGFMVQGGGFVADGSDIKEKGGQDKPIKNEWQNGLKNKRGALSMARTRVADSATSQFFINVVDNAGLDQAPDGAAYAVFGMVVSGMEVADEIVKVKRGKKGPHDDVPLEAVTIKSVVRISAEEAKKK